MDKWQITKQQQQDLDGAAAFVDKNLDRAIEIAKKHHMWVEGKDEHNALVVLRLMGEITQKSTEALQERLHREHCKSEQEPWQQGDDDEPE